MISRRAFLVGGVGLAGGILLAPDPLLAAAQCLATEDNILGPFYRPGAPLTNRLAGPDEDGIPLKVSGTVRGIAGITARSGCVPLSGALIEVWQASRADRPGPDRCLRHRPAQILMTTEPPP